MALSSADEVVTVNGVRLEGLASGAAVTYDQKQRATVQIGADNSRVTHRVSDQWRSITLRFQPSADGAKYLESLAQADANGNSRPKNGGKVNTRTGRSEAWLDVEILTEPGGQSFGTTNYMLADLEYTIHCRVIPRPELQTSQVQRGNVF